MAGREPEETKENQREREHTDNDVASANLHCHVRLLQRPQATVCRLCLSFQSTEERCVFLIVVEDERSRKTCRHKFGIDEHLTDMDISEQATVLVDIPQSPLQLDSSAADQVAIEIGRLLIERLATLRRVDAEIAYPAAVRHVDSIAIDDTVNQRLGRHATWESESPQRTNPDESRNDSKRHKDVDRPALSLHVLRSRLRAGLCRSLPGGTFRRSTPSACHRRVF